jgi:conjugal transfer mating pair stabilization protein TraN
LNAASTPATTTPTTPTVPATTTPTTPTTIPATAVYTCKSGYVLNASNKCVSSSITNATVTATVAYSCASGYALSDTDCTKQVSTGSLSVACPSGTYHRTGYGKLCFNSDLTPAMTTVSATTRYSCPTGYTLSGTNCNATTVSPTTTYTCPAGYVLNSSRRTCSKTVSMIPSSDLIASVEATSTTTSVWDAIVSWFSGWFR